MHVPYLFYLSQRNALGMQEFLVDAGEVFGLVAGVADFGKDLGKVFLAVLGHETAVGFECFLGCIESAELVVGGIGVLLEVHDGFEREAVGGTGFGFGRVTDGDRHDGNDAMGEAERFGYLGCVICGGAEVTCAEALHLGQSAELLGKDRCIDHPPSEALEVGEARFGAVETAPPLEAVEVETECERDHGIGDCGLRVVCGGEGGEALGLAGHDDTIQLHVPCVGGVDGLFEQGADE